MIVTVLSACFLIGCVAGLRSLTAPAAVCWGARLGWLHLAGAGMAWIGHPITVAIFTLLAIAELVVDKLPKTPPRTAAPGLIARIVLGAFSAYALAVSASAAPIAAVALGMAGALVGTFGGYHARHALVTKAHLADLPVALAEDAIAIVAGFVIVSHL